MRYEIYNCQKTFEYEGESLNIYQYLQLQRREMISPDALDSFDEISDAIESARDAPFHSVVVDSQRGYEIMQFYPNPEWDDQILQHIMNGWHLSVADKWRAGQILNALNRRLNHDLNERFNN